MFKRLCISIMAVLFVATVALAQDRCFTFEGAVRDRAPQPDIVASMGDAWIPQTPFYQLGIVEGQMLTYRFCVDLETNAVSLIEGSIWPVGGSGQPDLGDMRPEFPEGGLMPMNQITQYNDVTTLLIAGIDYNEYVQIPFSNDRPFETWQVNDALELAHRAHIDHNPDFFYNNRTYYDWVSVIYVDGIITEIDAMETHLDSDGCPDWIDSSEWQCNGRVLLSGMGHFNGDTFIGDGPLWGDILAWDQPGNVIPPFKQFDITDGMMQMRSYATESPANVRVRVNTELGVETYAPVLYDVTCISGVTDDPQHCPNGQEAFFMDALEPEGCECNEFGCHDDQDITWDGQDPNHPCAQSWKSRMERIEFEPIDTARVTINWVEKGLVAQQYSRPWEAKFPKYKLYPINFWDWNRPWTTGTDYNADYFVLPDNTGVQSFEVMVDGVVQKTLLFNVTTLDPMPTVSATKETADGLKMKLRGKEIKSGLKITWKDPKFKEIQKPGTMLRVYIGNSGAQSGYEHFYWIDCPAQIHKILVPMEDWQELKDKLIAGGHREAQIAIVYRTIDNNIWNHRDYPDMFPYNPEWGQFMNRGHSDSITVQLN